MNSRLSVAVNQGTAGEKNVSVATAILYADIVLTQAIASAFGGRLPRDLLRDRMSTLLDIVGQHNGRTLRKTDMSIAACFEDANEAVKSAINLHTDSERRRSTDQYPVTVRMVIDSAWNEGKKGTNVILDERTTIVQSLEESGIFVSKAVRANVSIEGLEFKELKADDSSLHYANYLKPVWREGMLFPPSPTVQNERFIHAVNLVRGDGRPCFYCGSKKHEAWRCPSKVLPQLTHGLHALGCMKIRDINDAFQQYIGEEDDPPKGTEDNGHLERLTPALSARHAFYELTRVFQLRFLNAIWDLQDHGSWQRIRNSDKMPLTGGKLRLAFDCLRTFQTDQAEELLKAIEWNNPRDFRFHCLMGFVCVERDALTMATHFFTKAYEYAYTQPQKIYTLLLRYRTLIFDGRKRQAEEILALCLNLDKTCPEAMFEDVLFKIGTEKGKEASLLIEDLVAGTNEYWTAGIISPDLSLHFDMVVPELNKLLEEVRREGRVLLKQANETISNLGRMLSEDDEELSGLKENYIDLCDKASADTFLGWRFVTKSTPKLIGESHRMIVERQNRVRKCLSDIAGRMAAATRSRHASHLSVRGRIEEIEEGVRDGERDLRVWQPHEQVLGKCAKLGKQLSGVEAKLEMLERADRRIAKARAFVRDFVLFLGITSLSAIGLTVCLLTFLKNSLVALPVSGVGWMFDILAVLVLFSSLFLALARTISKEESSWRRRETTAPRRT
jgi:hypothetical protein